MRSQAIFFSMVIQYYHVYIYFFFLLLKLNFLSPQNVILKNQIPLMANLSINLLYVADMPESTGVLGVPKAERCFALLYKRLWHLLRLTASLISMQRCMASCERALQIWKEECNLEICQSYNHQIKRNHCLRRFEVRICTL